MTKNASNSLMAAFLLALVILIVLAVVHPGYFANQVYLGGVIILELLTVAVWKFRQVFFPLLMLAFLMAGSDLPGASVFTSGRWVFLAVGAFVASLIALKKRELRFGFFQLMALFCTMAAFVSAAVSRFPQLATLKALSLLLLFLYAASGPRIAMAARENRFTEGLVTACEILVGLTAALYAAGLEPLGNPNSLGAVMSVVGAPILLWGMLVSNSIFLRRRRALVYALCLYLIYYSHARASILAAAITCGLLCVVAREYKLMAQSLGFILILITATAVVQPEAFSRYASWLTTDIVYKGVRDQGLLSSRQSPWQKAIDDINGHFWFGTGFGTSDNEVPSNMVGGNFASSHTTNIEYGNSYLAIVVWVGVIGALPFLLLLCLIIRKIFRTIRWMRITGSVLHPAVPLALVLTAGLLHAALEDWLFGVGYYLSVFFWSLAFVLVEIAPPLPAAPLMYSFDGRFRPIQPEQGVLTSGR